MSLVSLFQFWCLHLFSSGVLSTVVFFSSGHFWQLLLICARAAHPWTRSETVLSMSCFTVWLEFLPPADLCLPKKLFRGSWRNRSLRTYLTPGCFNRCLVSYKWLYCDYSVELYWASDLNTLLCCIWQHHQLLLGFCELMGTWSLVYTIFPLFKIALYVYILFKPLTVNHNQYLQLACHACTYVIAGAYESSAAHKLLFIVNVSLLWDANLFLKCMDLGLVSPYVLFSRISV